MTAKLILDGKTLPLTPADMAMLIGALGLAREALIKDDFFTDANRADALRIRIAYLAGQ